MANNLGQPGVGQALITGAALAQAGKDMAEQQLVGTWLASVSCAMHSLAVVGCFQDGGLRVASGHLSHLTGLVGGRTPAFAEIYSSSGS